MSDSYITRAFFFGPISVLGGIFLFVSGVVFGQFLYAFAQDLVGDHFVSSFFDFLFSLLISFGWGAMSGIGLILLLVDFWYIYRLMYKNESPVTFVLVIAASQVGLCLCASLTDGLVSEEWLGGVLVLLLLGFLYWGARRQKQN